jgi:hypothetical protein
MRLIRPPLALAVLAIALTAAAIAPPANAQIVPPGGWYIDLDSVRVDDPLSAQGDNVAMAVVAFRTRFGIAGSAFTDVWVQTPFRRVCTGARAGTTCTIPDSMGAVHFGSVNRPSLAEIAANQPDGPNTPEVVGTIQYFTYVDQIDDLTSRLALDGLEYWIGIFAGIAFPYRLTSSDSIAFFFVQLLEVVEDIAVLPGALPPYVTGMVGVAPELRDDVNLGILARHPTTLLRAGAAVLERRDLAFTHSNHSVSYVSRETVHFKPMIRP